MQTPSLSHDCVDHGGVLCHCITDTTNVEAQNNTHLLFRGQKSGPGLAHEAGQCVD